ncbi:hypothetical protein BGX29_002445 [Mortierella sp. GBA35]|nr:hypothetical protein BGX29_002445 [Mortierella sp. GBA35]
MNQQPFTFVSSHLQEEFRQFCLFVRLIDLFDLNWSNSRMRRAAANILGVQLHLLLVRAGLGRGLLTVGRRFVAGSACS